MHPACINGNDLPPPNMKQLTKRSMQPLNIDSSEILQEMRALRSRMIMESFYTNNTTKLLKDDDGLEDLTEDILALTDISSSPSTPVAPSGPPQSPYNSDEDAIILLDTPQSSIGVISETTSPTSQDVDFDKEMDDFDRLCNEVDPILLNQVDKTSNANALVCSICNTVLPTG